MTPKTPEERILELFDEERDVIPLGSRKAQEWGDADNPAVYTPVPQPQPRQMEIEQGTEVEIFRKGDWILTRKKQS